MSYMEAPCLKYQVLANENQLIFPNIHNSLNCTYVMISDVQELVRRSARKPAAKEVGKLKQYFQRLKEEQERRRVS